MSAPVNQQRFSSSSLGGWMLESSCIGPRRVSHSVHGGAGCFGMSISQESYFNSSCSAGGEWSVLIEVLQIQCWQQNVCVVNNQTSAQLSCHRSVISALEEELQKMKTCLTEHRIKYDAVLEMKTRLESEIAEYRRLLEGEGCEQKKALVIKQVTVEVEEQKPHIEKRVKTIVEEIVNGQVVSSCVDTQVHTVQ